MGHMQKLSPYLEKVRTRARACARAAVLRLLLALCATLMNPEP
jgi:hypothetical protein